MANESPVIFVSHAAVDSEIANQFKKDVEKNFLGLCRLFVSSNLDSIQAGGEWIQTIKQNLSKAKIFIGLISPPALSRPWIYTEFGAGWIREIPTISVCHSGLIKSELPVPLSHFQALDLLNCEHLDHLYSQISGAIGCQKPDINFEFLVDTYRVITEVHRIKRLVNKWVSQLKSWNPEFDKIFQGEVAKVLVPSEAEYPFREFKLQMEQDGYLEFSSEGFAMGTSVGMHALIFALKAGPNFQRFIDLLD